jgi:hypothetical protein
MMRIPEVWYKRRVAVRRAVRVLIQDRQASAPPLTLPRRSGDPRSHVVVYLMIHRAFDEVNSPESCLDICY